jgi:hypothetical protein
VYETRAVALGLSHGLRFGLVRVAGKMM